MLIPDKYPKAEPSPCLLTYAPLNHSLISIQPPNRGNSYDRALSNVYYPRRSWNRVGAVGRVVTYGVEVYDSHGIRDQTREATAKARAVPEHVIIIGKLGLPSDTHTHTHREGRSRVRSTRVRKSREVHTRGERGNREEYFYCSTSCLSRFSWPLGRPVEKPGRYSSLDESAFYPTYPRVTEGCCLDFSSRIWVIGLNLSSAF